MSRLTLLEGRVDSLLRLCELREAAFRATPRWRPLLRWERGKAWVAAVEEMAQVELLHRSELKSRRSATQAIHDIRGLHR